MMFYFVLSVFAFVTVAVLVPQIVRGLRGRDPFRPLNHVPTPRPAHTHQIGEGPRTSTVRCFDSTCTRDGDAYTIRRAREGRR